METVFLKILNMSITAGWLVLAVVLFRIVLKKAPKWVRCVLWGMVAMRLVCPFSIESALSLIPSGEVVPQEILYEPDPVIHTGVSFVNNVVNPVLSESLSPGVGDSVNPMQVVTFVASALWMIGMIVMALYGLISYIRLRRRVAVSMPVEGNIFICDDIDTPFILGIVKPRIYLPSTLSENQVPYVISHERAHLKRLDYVWKPFGYLLLTVYWFHPLMWVAYVLLCRDIELACDERVIRELGEKDKKSYSDALLECSVSRRMIVACPLAFGEVGVKERVRTVLNYKRPAFWVISIAVISCILVAVCFLTNPKETENSEPFGKTYCLESTAYSSGKEMISSLMYPIDFARYYFTEDMDLMCKEGIALDYMGDDWVLLGSMQEVKLTEENFDEYFREWQGLSGMPLDFSAEKYRKDNVKAWQLLLPGDNVMSYYLLQQKDGNVYLVCWYYDEDRENAPASDDSMVRWMFKLAVAEEEASVPVEYADASRLQEAEPEQTDFAELSGESAAGEVPEDNGDAEVPSGEAEAQADPLEEAIHAAILGSDASKIVEGVRLPCESHVILGSETLCVDGAAADGSPAGGMYLTVYLMVLTQDYTFGTLDGEIIGDGGSHMPVAITFKMEGDEYILEEYWRPGDGSYYESSIREKFPDDIEDEAMDTQKYIYAQIMDCYDQAVRFAGTDIDTVVGGLMEEVLSSPKEASDVATYIDHHSLTYRELKYYGKSTLLYCREQFEQGGQTGLKGQLMAQVCQDIAKILGWEQNAGDGYENGQQWYDSYGKELLAECLG